jgi:hypothetical protein
MGVKATFFVERSDAIDMLWEMNFSEAEGMSNEDIQDKLDDITDRETESYLVVNYSYADKPEKRWRFSWRSST